MQFASIPRAVTALIAAVTASLLMAGCTADEKPKADEKVSYLFVVNATDGSIRGGDNSLMLEMKLQNRSDYWFTDRPVRQAGHLRSKGLFGVWEELFKSDPPNAVLVVDSIRGVTAVPLTLKTAVLEDDTVTFEVSRLSSIPENSAAKGHKKASSVPNDFGHASLFIDDVQKQGYTSDCGEWGCDFLTR
jgi:hypothetical protein